jgi:hypothetical protein
MAATGLLEATEDHAPQLVGFAKDMIEAASEVSELSRTRAISCQETILTTDA